PLGSSFVTGGGGYTRGRHADGAPKSPLFPPIRFSQLKSPAASRVLTSIVFGGRGMPLRQFLLALFFLAFLHAGPSQAQGVTETGLPMNSIAGNWPNNGDPYGTRKWLYDTGFSYQLIWTNDALSNLSGGIRTGTIYQGKLETQFYIDLEKL